MDRKKNVLVLWSGGLDSTALLIHLIYSNCYNLIKVGYNEIANNEVQTARELKAIDDMLPYFKKFPNFENLGILNVFDINSAGNLLWPQVPIWLLSTAFIPYDIDEICFGYVMNDDAISVLPKIQKVFKSMSFMRINPNIKLTFPLIEYKKKQLWDNLPNEIKDKVVWCESSEANMHQSQICGECNSCKRFINECDANYKSIYKTLSEFSEDNTSSLVTADVKYDVSTANIEYPPSLVLLENLQDQPCKSGKAISKKCVRFKSKEYTILP